MSPLTIFIIVIVVIVFIWICLNSRNTQPRNIQTVTKDVDNNDLEYNSINISHNIDNLKKQLYINKDVPSKIDNQLVDMWIQQVSNNLNYYKNKFARSSCFSKNPSLFTAIYILTASSYKIVSLTDPKLNEIENMTCPIMDRIK